jgi:hypothetical protein
MLECDAAFLCHVLSTSLLAVRLLELSVNFWNVLPDDDSDNLESFSNILTTATQLRQVELSHLYVTGERWSNVAIGLESNAAVAALKLKCCSFSKEASLLFVSKMRSDDTSKALHIFATWICRALHQCLR